MRCACIAKDCGGANASCWTQIPPDLVVKSQPTDIVDIVLQLIRRPNGAHRACHSRKSRGEPFSTAEVQWSTTKSDGVWKLPFVTPTLSRAWGKINAASGNVLSAPTRTVWSWRRLAGS